MTTISIIIIGDEILSCKFKDENTPWLLDQCRQLGLRVIGVHIIPDTVDIIAETVLKASALSTYVFTTGGVGPTHDDVTMKGIAAAFDEPLRQHPVVADMIRAKAGDSPGALRMANLPASATLWQEEGMHFPQVVVKNVCIFPGVPKLMKFKFKQIAHRFKGTVAHVVKVYMNVRESEIAIELDAIQSKHKQVTIGSYPRFDEGPISLILTVESTDKSQAEAVANTLRNAFSIHLVQDTSPPQ